MLTNIALAGLLAASTVSATFSSVPLSRRASGDATLKGFTDQPNDHDQQSWSVEADIGGQKLTLLVDTGSSDLWVLSSRMNASQQAAISQGHTFYDPEKSSTFKEVDGSTFHISYAGSNFAAGIVGTDDIKIAGQTVNMKFGLCTEQNSEVFDGYDGILGLAFGAFSTMRPEKGLTFPQALAPQLDQPVYTLNLPQNLGNNLDFGKIDHSLYNGTLFEVNVDNGTEQEPNGWTVAMAFEVAGKNISSMMVPMLVDTGGLDMATADAEMAKNYWTQVSGSKLFSNGYWAFPCDAPSLPDLTYNFLSADGRWVGATVEGKFMNRTTTVMANEPGMCDGAMQVLEPHSRGSIGYNFFHNFFTVWDLSGPKLSFAPYPDQELAGQALSAASSSVSSSAQSSASSSDSASGSATSSGSSASATDSAASATGSASASASSANGSANASASASAAGGNAPSATGAADTAKATGPAPSGVAGAAPNGQPGSPSTSAPAASGTNTINQGQASGLQIPSFAIALLAVAGGALAL